MATKRIALVGFFILGILIAAVGWVLSPDFFRATLPPSEFKYLTQDNIRMIELARTAIIVTGILLMGVGIAIYRFQSILQRILVNLFQLEPPASDAAPSPSAVFDLFLVSFLGLFFETLVIRWLSTEVRWFAYYKNVALIAAFMGLGLGFMLAKKRIVLFQLFPLSIAIFSALILVGSANGFFRYLANPAASDVWIWSAMQHSALPSLLSFFGLIPLFFLLTILLFVPLGQATGQAMHPFSPIKAYTINILGSLVGVWGFAVLSFLNLPPLAWFCVGLLLCLWLLRHTPRTLITNVGIVAIFLGLAWSLRGDAYWSPYYRIDVQPMQTANSQGRVVQWGYSLNVNYDFHQSAANLSPAFVTENGSLFPDATEESAGYALPYQLLNPKTVLVVGAGSGNDVASALRGQVERIDAVDIDPVILQIGQKLHPENPYASPRVNLVVDDARTFFKNTSNQYDLIVYGMLDSHTLFSSMSSLRLDNFVYTLEGIREAKQHLNDHGTLAIFFLTGQDWITQRLYNIITDVFGREPTLLITGHGPLYLIGPGFDPANLGSLPPETGYMLVPMHRDTSIENSTDDWPFLYLRAREIPDAYVQVLVLLTIVAIIVIRMIAPKAIGTMNWHFFLLGAAFLLLEVKSVTDLALLFGSTWIVNSIVISAVLVMVLAANYYVQRFHPADLRIYYVFLIGSVLFGYWLPIDALLGQSIWVRTVASSVVISLPLFFAGIIFSTSLKRVDSIEIAFGSNLLGSVIGGLLEYASLVLGLRNLMLLALALYASSYVATRSKGK